MTASALVPAGFAECGAALAEIRALLLGQLFACGHDDAAAMSLATIALSLARIDDESRRIGAILDDAAAQLSTL